MSILSEKLAQFRAVVNIIGSEASTLLSITDDNLSLQQYENLVNNDINASRILKKDFLMVPKFTEGGLYNDASSLQRVSGILNYAQGITHRLLTYRGTMPGDSNFGVPWLNYLGRTYKNKSLIIANLSNDIQEEVLKDPRTSSVDSLDIDFLSPEVINVNITLIPIFTNANQAVEIFISSGE